MDVGNGYEDSLKMFGNLDPSENIGSASNSSSNDEKDEFTEQFLSAARFLSLSLSY